MDKVSSVDAYLGRHEDWHAELSKLRELLLKSGMQETIKWGGPCYTVDGKNVVGIGAFKEHVALWFHQGALLSDPDKVLINAQEGTTRALRQWRFSRGEKIPVRKVQSYLREARENQHSGKAIKADRSKPVNIPKELNEACAGNPDLKAAFAALTKSQQREYTESISGGKRAETRAARLEKSIPMILKREGLNDKYRK